MSLERIGRMLKDEARRFVDYNEIESISKELGFPVSVRTLRFYVDEGILPPPNRLGKKPVYDHDWILNVLLSLHIMKTRLNRQLKDIRTIFTHLTEDPKFLADKLSILYQDVVKSSEYASVQRDWIVNAFFAALTGQFCQPKQASEVSLNSLSDIATEPSRWAKRKGQTYWTEPEMSVSLRKLFGPDHSNGKPKIRIRAKGEDTKPAIKIRSQEIGELLPANGQKSLIEAKPKTKPRLAKRVVGELEVVEESEQSDESTSGTVKLDLSGKPMEHNEREVVEVPENGISMLDARAMEDFFVRRVETSISNKIGTGIYDCIAKKALAMTPRNCTPLKRDNTSAIIQTMKSLQIFDRELLDLIPIERSLEYHIYKSGFFGRGELRVIVAALTVSPTEEFLTKHYGETPQGPKAIERAIADLVIDPGKSYYVGVLSTTGWTASAREFAPSHKNLELHLIERGKFGGWDMFNAKCVDAEPILDSVFDPETDVEKTDRIKNYIFSLKGLSLKGGHVVLSNVCEDLNLPNSVVRQATELLVEDHADLVLAESAGHEILKRKRF